MERLLDLVKKCLRPGWKVIPLLVLTSTAALYVVFTRGMDETPLAYVSYLLSAYALVTLVAALVQAARPAWHRVRAIPLVARWLEDNYFRVRFGLILSFQINLCYAGFRVVCAVLYRSFWDGALGAYYILLCAVRLYLIHRTPRSQKHTDYRRELRSCRWAGCYLLALNLALLWISVQIVQEGQHYDYPGTLIYVAALYAFYCLTLAIVNAIKYRKFQGPVLTAAKAVSLTTALVSIFSLETAMLTQFGGGETFQFLMTASTAGAVCVLVLLIALFLVISASRKLKQSEGGNHDGSYPGTGG